MNIAKHLCNVALVFISGMIAGAISIYKFSSIRQNSYYTQQLSYRNLNMINQWLILKMRGIDIATRLKKNGIRCIAIYGMGINGRHLVRELCHTDIKIAYGMDQKKMQPYMGVNIVKVESGLPEVDLIVNSVIYAQDEISQELKLFCKCPVISLEDLVFGSY